MITQAWVLPLPSLTVQGSVGTSLSKPGAALFPAQLVSRIAQSGTGASTPQRSPYRAIGNHAPGPSRPARAGHRARTAQVRFPRLFAFSARRLETIFSRLVEMSVLAISKFPAYPTPTGDGLRWTSPAGSMR